MGSQASRDTCEGDIRLQGTRLLSPIYVADLREERSENVLRTVSASPFIFDMTVSSTSGVITTPPEDLPREVLPLTTEVNILYGVNTGTPFVVPPALDIERPVM